LRVIFKNNASALVALIIFSFSTNLAYFAQEARSYSMFLFLSISAYYLCLRLSKENRFFWLFVFICTLGMYTHVLFLFVLLNCFLFSALNRNDKLPEWKNVFTGTIISGFLYIPWLILLLTKSVDPSLTPVASEGILKTLVVLFAGLLNGNGYAGLVFGAVTCLSSFVLFLIGIKKRGGINSNYRSVILLWIVSPVILLLITLPFIRNIYGFFHFRYLIHIMPFLIIFITTGIISLVRNVFYFDPINNKYDIRYLRIHIENNKCWLYVFLMSAIFAFTFCSISNLICYYRAQNQNWRGAWEYIQDNRQTNHPLVIHSIANASITFYDNHAYRHCQLPILYGHRPNNREIILRTNSVKEIINVFKEHRKTWIIYYKQNWNPKYFNNSFAKFKRIAPSGKTFHGLYGDVIVAYSDRHLLYNDIGFVATLSKAYYHDGNSTSFDPELYDYYVPKLIPSKSIFVQYSIDIPCANIEKGKFILNSNIHTGETIQIRQNKRIINVQTPNKNNITLNNGPFLVRIIYPAHRAHKIFIKIKRSTPIEITDEGTGPEYDHYFLDWIRE
jgi:hypothetical protein